MAPGGAYSILAVDREGNDIAQWLNSIGVSAFVLKYRVPSRGWLPFGAAPLMDALLRSRNANQGVLNMRQIVLGTFDQVAFSAPLARGLLLPTPWLLPVDFGRANRAEVPSFSWRSAKNNPNTRH